MIAKMCAAAVSVTTSVLIVTAPHPAAALIDESLVYPGSNCIKVSGGDPTFSASTNASDLSLLNGRMINNTASNMVVQCPMYDNGTDFQGNVWVLDNSVSANVTCCSKYRNPLGNAANQCA